jgi:hypothetical protein
MSFYVADHFVDTTIIDQSIIVPSEPIMTKRLTVLQAIFSSKGKANQIMNWGNSSLVKDHYGQDMENLDKYGQGGINLLHVMSAGASGQVCRLLPHNSETASLLVGLEVKVRNDIPVYERDIQNNIKIVDVEQTDSNGDIYIVKEKVIKTDENGNPIFTEGLEFKCVQQVGRLTDDTDGASNVVYNIDGDEQSGVKEAWIPLWKILYSGPGKCGNDVSHSIKNDFLRDDETSDGRRYMLQFYRKDQFGNNNKMNETLYFSLNPDARMREGSEVMETLSVVYPERDENGNEREVIVKPFIEKNFDLLNSLIGLYTDDPLSVDPINCVDKVGKPYDQFIKSEENDAVDYEDGIYALTGGTDGSLEVGLEVESEQGGTVIVTQAMADATKKSLLVEFFHGQIDPALFEERFVDSDIYLDANYDIDVKKELLGKFRTLRPDIMVIADIGFARNVAQAITAVKEIYGMVDGITAYTAAVLIHAGVTTDRALPLRLTGTYDWGYGLARCFNSYGTFSVFAGYQAAKVQTMRFDWYPYKDEFDTMLGPLKKLGCIYAVEIERGKVWAYMSEKTMYVEKFSKLKSIRNGMVVGDGVRMGKKILVKYIYDNGGAEGSIKKATEEMYATIQGRYPNNINVTPVLYRTKRDIQLDTSSCDLAYEFPGMTEAWNYTIYARRTSADMAAATA